MKVVDILKKQPADRQEFIAWIETGKGERSKVTLPDSTVVWLNGIILHNHTCLNA